MMQTYPAQLQIRCVVAIVIVIAVVNRFYMSCPLSSSKCTPRATQGLVVQSCSSKAMETNFHSHALFHPLLHFWQNRPANQHQSKEPYAYRVEDECSSALSDQASQKRNNSSTA